MADTDFDRRAQMMASAEKGDFGVVNALLKADAMLTSFSGYLTHLVSNDKVDALRASLVLPNLDKNNPNFAKMIEDAVVHAAHRGNKEAVELLLPLSKKPADDATRALSQIFNSTAPGEAYKPNEAVGEYLFKNGADVDRASALRVSELKKQMASATKELKGLNLFKRKITADPKTPCANCECTPLKKGPC